MKSTQDIDASGEAGRGGIDATHKTVSLAHRSGIGQLLRRGCTPYKSSAVTSPAFIDHSIFLGRGGATLKAPPPESRAWAQFVYSTIYRSSSRAGRSSSRPQMAIGQTGRRSWQIRLSRPRSNHPYLVHVLKNSLKVVYLPVGINFEVIGIQLQCTLDHGPVVVIRAHGVEDFVLSYEPVPFLSMLLKRLTMRVLRFTLRSPGLQPIPPSDITNASSAYHVSRTESSERCWRPA